MDKGPAYFKKLVGANSVVTRIARFGETTVTDELKRAFRSQEGISCTIRFKNGYLHAINIWGAEFDAQGELSAIYITDNNDTELDSQPDGFLFLDRFKTQAGIVRKPVQFRNGQCYMEGSYKNGFDFLIEEFNLLGLMREKWEEYFLHL